MMTNLDRLAYMANQIARNFAAMVDDPAKATADHIASFWDPRMRRLITEAAAAGTVVLDEPARRAVALLAVDAHPPHQTRATEFNAVDEAGGSDAG